MSPEFLRFEALTTAASPKIKLSLAALRTRVDGELDRVSQALTGRMKQLAERYARPLPQLAQEVGALSAKVDEHLRKMGFAW